jgi:hypothetical protein
VIRFEPEGVVISDELETTSPEQVTAVELPRSFSAIHMGSAKYFHASELASVREADASGLAETLRRDGRARLTQRVDFGARVKVEDRATDGGTAPRSEPEREDVLRR